MTRPTLPRPRAAALSPSTCDPPGLVALTANVRDRLAFWCSMYARGTMHTGGWTTFLPGVPVVLAGDYLRRGACMTADGRERSIVDEAAPIIARAIVRVVEGIAPRKVLRAVLERPSLGWRFPVAAVAEREADPIVAAAGYVDDGVVVLGAVDVPAHAGVAERIVASVLGGEAPRADATRCIPWAWLAPPGVTVPDVLAALRDSPDGDARAAAEVIEESAAEGRDYLLALRDRGLSQWSPRAVAAVLYTMREFRAVHENHPAFAFPTSEESNAAVNHMTARSSLKRSPRAGDPALAAGLREDVSARRVSIQVQWEGRMLPSQLCFDFDGDVTSEALAVVLDNMADDGLRDWLALHALADMQGRTGAVRWAWEDHRRVAGYAARVAAGGRTSAGRETDDTLRRAVIARLWQFTRAALLVNDGKRLRRIGDGPFAAITVIGDAAGLGQRADDFTHAGIAINRALYLGAHCNAKGGDRHFTGITPAVFGLRGGALRLAVFILRAERVNRDRGLRVEFTERQLMQYARVRGDGRPQAKHVEAARAELARYVAAVADAFNAGETPGSLATMTPDPSRLGVYQWTPARWRVEREQLGAAPDRPALPPPDRPYTGAALRSWREARELSQADAAKVLGVGVATVKRAEGKGDAPLPRALCRPGVPWHVTRRPALLGAPPRG